MSDTRAVILGNIRKGLGRNGPLPEAEAAALAAGPAVPARHVIPARGDLAPTKRAALFVSMAEEAAATVDRVNSATDVPAAIAGFLANNNLPTRLVRAPDARLAALPWEKAPMLDVGEGLAGPDDPVSVTPAFAGIAETGTLMLLSGPDHPSTLNLLPDAHIAVVWEGDLVGCVEDGWDRLRARAGDGDDGFMPRTVLFVTGPSRSADIEQTLQMGAHGPRQLHIVLVKGDAPATR